MAKIGNPFRFGSVVTGKQFIDRTDKIKFVRDVMNSGNSLVIISPRRFGKTSLALYATERLERPIINLNIQNITDEMDFARQLIKMTLHAYPVEKIKYAFRHFSVTPTIVSDPITGKIEVALSPSVKGETAIEEAFELLEQVGKHKKPIVIFDEFQDVFEINASLLKKLRSIMQLQQNINYILLGSQESMMREIFEKKKSPFFHFGTLLHLSEIPENEFSDYLFSGFRAITEADISPIVRDILKYTKCHPYYTQELAFYVWNTLKDNGYSDSLTNSVINDVVTRKDYDYERLWARLTNNNKKLLRALVSNPHQGIYTKEFINKYNFTSTSTVRGCVTKLTKDGFILYNATAGYYYIEDPFFATWISRMP